MSLERMVQIQQAAIDELERRLNMICKALGISRDAFVIDLERVVQNGNTSTRKAIFYEIGIWKLLKAGSGTDDYKQAILASDLKLRNTTFQFRDESFEVVTVATREYVAEYVAQHGGGGTGSGSWGNIGGDIEDQTDLIQRFNTVIQLISNHTSNSSNPHNVTKSQIGLGNVPDLDTTDAVQNNHTHVNQAILDSTTESFTTVLKNSYDSAVDWILFNESVLLNHLSDTNNPHNVTKAQVGLANVPNVDATNPDNIQTTPTKRFVNSNELLWVRNINPGVTVGGYNPSEPATPPQGLSIIEALDKLVFPPIAPTITSLTTSVSTLPYKQANASVTVNYAYTIGTVGGSITGLLLEVSRDGGSTWTTLTTTIGTTFTYNNIPNNSNATIRFRLTVTNSSNLTASQTINVTYIAYVAPTITLTLSRTGDRERGDVQTTISGTAVRNSVNVNMLTYSIQVSVNGGAWSTLFTDNVNSSSSATIPAFNHNDAALAVLGTNSIQYRIIITNDGEATTNGTAQTINFRSRSYFGYNTATTITSSQAIALGNSALVTSRTRSFSGVTASGGNYTYYAYPQSFGNLTSVILDGAAPILGAFALSTLSVTNSFGIVETYNVYRSNATNAFTNNSIAFS